MRRRLSSSLPAEAMEELLGVMRQTRSNDELIAVALERM